MGNQQNHKQIEAVYKMLLEMVNGNLDFRIPLHAADMQFNEIAIALNGLAEGMLKAGYLSPYSLPLKQDALDGDPLDAVIHKVKEYILTHLEDPLPSSKELAAIYGTNEFTLKDGFRRRLHTSIYQFYNDGRLKKAHFLIEKTAIALKEIAFICGFNDYTNFFKAFRKKYGCNPSAIPRNTPADEL